VFALALAALHGRALVGHVVHSLDPGVFNDDARQQIVPFFRYSDREPFRDDALGDYFLVGTPVVLRALYTAAALVHDAVPVSKALPYLLLLLTVAGVVGAASALGSRWSALASASLVLGGSIFLARMAGGLARGFAFPLLALGLAFLAAGRLRRLVILVPIAAGLYPPVAVLLGLAAAFATLLPSGERGDLAGWSALRRFLLLAGAALLAVAVALPPVLGLRAYGRMITPAMVPEYPEAGPGGRYDAEDRPPFAAVLPASVRALGRALRPGGSPLVKPFAGLLGVRIGELPGPLPIPLYLAVLAFLLAGGAVLVRRSVSARRILALGVAVLVAYPVSCLAYPHLFLPGRYLFYAVPLLAAVLLPAAAAETVGLLARAVRVRSRRWVAPATAALVVASFGGTGNSAAGMQRHVAAGAPLFAAVSNLPRSSLLAGWPTGPINSVPYACRRRVLLSWELHQAFHTGYVAEMRRRMRAFIDAYFATSPEPLLRLRDELGVTHLIVHLPHLQGAPPAYFAPYQEWIAEALRRAEGHEYLALRLAVTHAVFADEENAILDLTALDSGSPDAPRPPPAAR